MRPPLQCNEAMSYRKRQMLGGGIPMVQLPVNTLPSEEQLQRDPFFSASQTKQSSSEKVELTNKDF